MNVWSRTDGTGGGDHSRRSTRGLRHTIAHSHDVHEKDGHGVVMTSAG